MALPQSTPLLVDAPLVRGVPLRGLHPPVSIVVERNPVHKQNHSVYRQFGVRRVRVPSQSCRFCYDEGVWQRQAVRTGRQAVHTGRQFVKHVVPAVIKPARTLWNEVIGFVFLCIGVMFGFKAGRLYLDFANSTAEGKGTAFVRLALATACTLLMAYFALTSFLKARKISRS